jgi:hypothetical protein
MQITDSNLVMSSSHARAEHHERKESLTVWRAERGPAQTDSVRDGKSLEALSKSLQRESEHVDISRRAQRMQPATAVLEEPAEPDPMIELETLLLKLLVERLTGRKIRLYQPAGSYDAAAQVHSPPEAAGKPSPERPGWGIAYHYYESHYESEQASFAVQGVVNTRDGRQINLDLELNMSREFYTEKSLSLRAGDALKDPLAVNFNGTAAELAQTRFNFDIDADGRMDQIAFVRPGSGLLALDRNGDGTINDGRELIGALSGNGFVELSVSDDDGNGWIDENDAIYDQLRIWSRDAEGNDSLIALGQKGVGAIYLGHVETPFLLKDGDNQTLGRVRDSGVFLHEDGVVGSIQQLDLVV